MRLALIDTITLQGPESLGNPITPYKAPLRFLPSRNWRLNRVILQAILAIHVLCLG